MYIYIRYIRIEPNMATMLSYILTDLDIPKDILEPTPLNPYPLTHTFRTEPNMATMLAYILTDLDIPKDILEKILKKIVENSFNSISVDGDQSTSDTVYICICKYLYKYIYIDI
jgi:N-acetylglutamate synthase/N-acetylornithine aminotransferase